MLPEDQEKADKTLRGACQRLTRQQFYNQKHTTTSLYSSEKLRKRAPKHLNVKAQPKMTEEDYAGVSKLSIRFYVVVNFIIHSSNEYCFFSLCTRGPMVRRTHGGRCWRGVMGKTSSSTP